jgi:hypothetical protein
VQPSVEYRKLVNEDGEALTPAPEDPAPVNPTLAPSIDLFPAPEESARVDPTLAPTSKGKQQEDEARKIRTTTRRRTDESLTREYKVCYTMNYTQHR